MFDVLMIDSWRSVYEALTKRRVTLRTGRASWHTFYESRSSATHRQ